jgi:L-threonylcarbamoyladenylate synthase
MPEVDLIAVAKGAEILRSDGIVAFATETVYGLGADATSARGIERIYEAKGRPATNPLIVHVRDEAMARKYTSRWPAAAEKLARAFWPGPLTLVVPRGPQIVPAVSAGLETIGVRAPNHPLAQALLEAFDGPIAAPSANRSNRISPTTAQHVWDELGDAVDLILDGGPCQIGIESTVVDVSGAKPAILRPGSVTWEQIKNVIGDVGIGPDHLRRNQAARSPGQLAVHYAPVTPAYFFEGAEAGGVGNWCKNHPHIRIAIIAIEGSVAEKEIQARSAPLHQLIRAPGDAATYARNLYAMLREADAGGYAFLWIAMPDLAPAWRAIRDRLARAAKHRTNPSE